MILPKIKTRTSATLADVAEGVKGLRGSPGGELVAAFETIHVAGALYHACVWYEDGRYGSKATYDIAEVVPLLGQMGVVENGRAEPRLVALVTDPDEPLGGRGVECGNALRDRKSELILRVTNGEPWQESGPCEDPAVQAQAEDLVRILLSPNGDALLNAFTAQSFSDMDALTTLAAGP